MSLRHPVSTITLYHTLLRNPYTVKRHFTTKCTASFYYQMYYMISTFEKQPRCKVSSRSQSKKLSEVILLPNVLNKVPVELTFEKFLPAMLRSEFAPLEQLKVRGEEESVVVEDTLITCNIGLSVSGVCVCLCACACVRVCICVRV